MALDEPALPGLSKENRAAPEPSEREQALRGLDVFIEFLHALMETLASQMAPPPPPPTLASRLRGLITGKAFVQTARRTACGVLRWRLGRMAASLRAEVMADLEAYVAEHGEGDAPEIRAFACPGDTGVLAPDTASWSAMGGEPVAALADAAEGAGLAAEVARIAPGPPRQDHEASLSLGGDGGLRPAQVVDEGGPALTVVLVPGRALAPLPAVGAGAPGTRRGRVEMDEDSSGECAVSGVAVQLPRLGRAADAGAPPDARPLFGAGRSPPTRRARWPEARAPDLPHRRAFGENAIHIAAARPCRCEIITKTLETTRLGGAGSDPGERGPPDGRARCEAPRPRGRAGRSRFRLPVRYGPWPVRWLRR